MPRPAVVKAPPVAQPKPGAVRPAGGFRPMAGASSAANPASQAKRSGSLSYGGRGEPPGPEAGYDACLDWAAFGGLENAHQRALAVRAWMGSLTREDAL